MTVYDYIKGTSNQPDLSIQHLEWWVKGENWIGGKMVNLLNITLVLMVSLWEKRVVA